MSAIFGIIGQSAEATPTQQVLERMGQTLRHRGPDDCRLRLFGRAGLGTSRLDLIEQ